MMKKLWRALLTMVTVCAVILMQTVSFKQNTLNVVAAVKQPVIVKKSTIKVGEKKQITIAKNGYIISKITAKSSQPKTVKVSVSGKKGIVVKGLKAGTAVINLKIRARKNRIVKTFNLKCKINVKNKTTSESDEETEQTDPNRTKDVTVSNQKELLAALEDKTVATITISEDTKALTIDEGNYSTIRLIVNAPNATISNFADFKSIEIKAIAENTWREYGKSNKINVSASDPCHIIAIRSQSNQ